MTVCAPVEDSILTLGSAFQEDAIGPSRALPRDVVRIPGLAWRDAGLTGEVIYSPDFRVATQDMMEILCAHFPAHFQGRLCTAIVIHRCDRQTQEVCARRLIASMPLMRGMAEIARTVHLHRPQGQVTVITADWSDRDAIARAIARHLPRIVKSDPSFSRALLRGSMGKPRLDYDTMMLKKFRMDAGDIWSHLRGPHSHSFRFSDFLCRSRIRFGYGVVYDLKFDDPEVLHIAQDWIDRIRSAVNGAYRGRDGTGEGCAKGQMFPLRFVTRQISDFNDTSLIWDEPCVTLSARFNHSGVTRSMALILSCICGIRTDLLKDFNLTQRDLGE